MGTNGNFLSREICQTLTVGLEAIMGDTVLLEAWRDWIAESADWKVFLTLTHPAIVSQSTARKTFHQFIGLLEHRDDRIHDSKRHRYRTLSYVAGFEPQLRGSYHTHALISTPIPYADTHLLWSRLTYDGMLKRSGLSWIETITSRGAVSAYVSKYVVKQGLVDVYLHDAPMANILHSWG
jgi:hypothetical protein